MAVGAAVVALLVMPDCEPDTVALAQKASAIPKVVAQSQPAVVVQSPVAEAPEEPPPPEEHIARQDRPEFAPVGADAPPWLDAFRHQVAARSSRLAACFVGVDGPGRLQWTTTVSGIAGRVSHHALSPIGSSSSLTTPERTCLLGVLSAPRYDLRATDGSAIPSRVRLLLAY
jgi:hypothetical protein